MSEVPVVLVKVAHKYDDEVIFEGKVSADVLPWELLHLDVFRKACVTLLQDRSTQREVTNFQGSDTFDLVGSFPYKKHDFCGVLFWDNNLVLRKSLQVLPLTSVSSMAVWNLSHDECMKVFECESLEDLEIHHCKLSKVPKGVEQLKKLKSVRLFHLKELKTDIADEIGQLSSLKELRIERCEIEMLPKGIGGLKQLEVLSLKHLRRLTSLPEEIGHLSSLKNILMENCEIERLPDSICDWNQLETMTLSGLYNMTTLPERFGELRNMKELYISNLDLESLPDSMGQLEMLERLTVQELTELTCFPESFAQLKSLKSLVVVRSGVKTLVKVVAGWKQLQLLCLSGLTMMDYLPDELGQLLQLKELQILECNVTKVPKSFGQMEKLEKLVFAGLIHLNSLPEEIGHLPNLKALTIHSCGCESLPKSLKELKHIEALSLSDLSNFVPSRDDILLLFSKLKVLTIHSCIKFFQSTPTWNPVKVFCDMLKTTVHLSWLRSNMLQEVALQQAFEQNGSIVFGGIYGFADGHCVVDSEEVLKRNQSNHARAMESIVCMMCVRKWKQSLNYIPKEMVQMIAKMLWITRCDIEAWKNTHV